MFAILLFIGVGIGGLVVGSPAENPILQLSMAEFEGCNGRCIYCDVFQHEYRISSHDQEYQDLNTHGCASGPCGAHGACEWEEEDAQELAELTDPEFSAKAESLRVALLAPSSTEQLKVLIDEYGAFVYVPERNAIQIMGCTGEVIAHVPVTLVQAVALQQQ